MGDEVAVYRGASSPEGRRLMPKKIPVDILEMEVTLGLDHWLSPTEAKRHENDEKKQAIRDKHRKAHEEKKRADRVEAAKTK